MPTSTEETDRFITKSSKIISATDKPRYYNGLLDW
jgi:hypothetical protein